MSAAQDYGILGRTHINADNGRVARLSRLRASMVVHRLRCDACKAKRACRPGARLSLKLDAAEARAIERGE